MTAERMAGVVARWVRLYTRNLPAPVAGRRIDEIDADLHDHIAHERAERTPEWRIALGIAARMARGLAADASWRRRHAIARRSTSKGAMKMSKPSQRSAVRVAAVTALILLVPLVGMQLSDEVAWGVGDFVLAAALLAVTGAVLELAARRPASIAYRLIAMAIAAAAIVLGEADDAPGLVLFGCLLIVGTFVLAVRTAQRRA